MAKIRRFIHWLLQDLTQRRGKYVIAEVPNAPLLVFMVSLIISIIIYPGIVQKALLVVSYIALLYWGVLEARSGRSRFRKLLGILGLIGAVGAALLLFTQ